MKSVVIDKEDKDITIETTPEELRLIAKSLEDEIKDYANSKISPTVVWYPKIGWSLRFKAAVREE